MSQENEGTSKAPFRFLKRGEGTTKFGRFGLPGFSATGASSRVNMDRGTIKNTANRAVPGKEGKDSGVDEAGSLTTTESPQHRTLSETEQFEQWERHLQDSVSTDASYNNFTKGLSAESRRRSSPKVTALKNIATQPQYSVAPPPPPPLSDFVNLPRFQAPPRQPPPQTSSPGPSARLFENKEKDLVSRMAIFEESLSRLKAHEKMLMELEDDLRRGEERLKREAANFEKQKLEELDRLKKTEDEILRRKAILDKRETEQVKILKEQIKDLQNDICERDAKISALRSKMKDLEKENGSLKTDSSEIKAEIARWRDRCSTVEEANAQLRLRCPGFKAKSTKTTPFGKKVTFEVPKPSSVDVQDNVIVSDVPPNDANSSEQSVPEGSSFEVRQERRLADGTVERVLENGTVIVENSNGRTWRFTNGDSRRVLTDGTEVYWYSQTNRTVITEPDGTERVKFSDGREDIHRRDGTIDTRYPDGTRRILDPAGRTERIFFLDGSEEIKSPEYFERKFPSGEVKTVYADNSTVTRYTDGRIRVKDPEGRLLHDSSLPQTA